ncbi:DeSI-like protein At4g17486 [Linum grandiflorum]
MVSGGSQKGNRWHSIDASPLKAKLANKFCIFPKEKNLASYTRGDTPVYLNVYDLTTANGYVYWAGLGIFHSAVEVHGVEYAFGAHDLSTTGVFDVEPRNCPGYMFRRSIFMGTTTLDPKQVREFMERQSANYNGDTYHLIFKNCNHFSQDICYKLTGKSIPKWVNRLAKIGSVCNCVLPETLRDPSGTYESSSQDECESEKKRLRRSGFSAGFSSVSISQAEGSISSLFRHSSYYSMQHPPWELRKSAVKSVSKDEEEVK